MPEVHTVALLQTLRKLSVPSYKLPRSFYLCENNIVTSRALYCLNELQQKVSLLSGVSKPFSVIYCY
jgi:hypothetical protein